MATFSLDDFDYDHKEKANELLRRADSLDNAACGYDSIMARIAAAQVHATLALAQATRASG